MTTVPISVIIPTLNRKKTLKQTVNNLLSGEIIPNEVIIIDQSDISVTEEEFVFIKDVHIVIISETIKSSSHARNVGIANASNEILLFMDDDILLDKKSISILWDRISENNICLVSGVHYSQNSCFTVVNEKISARDILGTITGQQLFWKKNGYVLKATMRGRYSRRLKEDYGTEWAMGYFFCVKKSILDKFDITFDENLVRYAYAEDLDFTYRYCSLSQSLHLKNVIEPKIYINHLATKEWRVPKRQEVVSMYANRRYLSYKLFPKNSIYRFTIDLFDSLYCLSQITNKNNFNQIRDAISLCHKHRALIKSGELEELLNKI